jgi:hypothetical protein
MDIEYDIEIEYDSEIEWNILNDEFEITSNSIQHLDTTHTPLVSNIELASDEEVLCEYIDELYNTLYSIFNPEQSAKQFRKIFKSKSGKQSGKFWISGIKSLSNEIYN